MPIRLADPARDAASCAAIYAPAVTDGYASFEETAPSAEAMAQRIAEATLWLVNEDIGYACATPFHPRAAYRWAVTVAAYVHPDHQGRGIGRELYDVLLTELAGQGLRWAMAGIALPNEASVRLHEAHGFKRVGTFEQIGYKAGEWRDVGWWQRSLRLPPCTRS